MPPALILLVVVVLAACSWPTVKVETPKPIAVDINMRVDIFQHEGIGAATPAESPGDAEDRRRARMEEIQTLKNSRLVGENHDALLSIRDLPPGEYGRYVRRTVDAENADREILVRRTAETEGRPPGEVRRDLADLWRERSFEGEWIERARPDGTWVWVQKAPSGKE